MKQFYELYKDDEKVSPLVTQLSWTNHLKIMPRLVWMVSWDEHIWVDFKSKIAGTADQWKRNGTGWWYEHSDGSYKKDGWKYIDGY